MKQRTILLFPRLEEIEPQGESILLLERRLCGR